MKTWYDKSAKTQTLKPGDKALILLPVLGSALQAQFSGPYDVLEKVSDQDYIVATPDRRRGTRLCHINMMYFDGNTDRLASARDENKTVLALSGADLPEAGTSETEGFGGPSSEVVQDRLKNSEMLSCPDTFLEGLNGALITQCSCDFSTPH